MARILKSELEDEDNPYNTYKNKGLPPTPIANPGRAAIEAALNPAKTSDLYFVAEEQAATLSRTYADHQRNVAKWRQIEKEREDEQPAVGPAASGGWNSLVLDKLQASDIPLPQRNPHR